MATTTKTARSNGKAPAKAATVSAKAPAKRTSKPKGFDGAELSFTLERETKNTYRYAEDDAPEDRNAVTLYLPKEIIGDAAPETITVTVS